MIQLKEFFQISLSEKYFGEEKAKTIYDLVKQGEEYNVFWVENNKVKSEVWSIDKVESALRHGFWVVKSN